MVVAGNDVPCTGGVATNEIAGSPFADVHPTESVCQHIGPACIRTDEITLYEIAGGAAVFQGNAVFPVARNEVACARCHTADEVVSGLLVKLHTVRAVGNGTVPLGIGADVVTLDDVVFGGSVDKVITADRDAVAPVSGNDIAVGRVDSAYQIAAGAEAQANTVPRVGPGFGAVGSNTTTLNPIAGGPITDDGDTVPREIDDDHVFYCVIGRRDGKTDTPVGDEAPIEDYRTATTDDGAPFGEWGEGACQSDGRGGTEVEGNRVRFAVAVALVNRIPQGSRAGIRRIGYLKSRSFRRINP